MKIKVYLLVLILFVCNMSVVNKIAWGSDSDKDRTTGVYKGHKWYINSNHILWWDEKPCIPFTTNQIWIDHDKFPASRFDEHFKWLDDLTNNLTKKGETYFILFITHPDINSITDLKKQSVKEKFEKEWRKFAPAIAKDGLRAVTFYNEINSIVPPRVASDPILVKEYGRILNDYGKSMKQIVGNVPVILKIAGDWSIDPIMSGIQGEYIDGLGGDFFASEPDRTLTRQMIKPIALLNKARKTKLFWITEFSRQAGEEPHNYWPAFRSKSQMRSFLDIFVSHGATGFFYFTFKPNVESWKKPGGRAQVTKDTQGWFQEFENEVKNKILSFKGGVVLPDYSSEDKELTLEAEIEGSSFKQKMSENEVLCLIKDSKDLQADLFQKYPGYDLKLNYISQNKIWKVKLMTEGRNIAVIIVDDEQRQVIEVEMNK